jgi:hypothetical protein
VTTLRVTIAMTLIATAIAVRIVRTFRVDRLCKMRRANERVRTRP